MSEKKLKRFVLDGEFEIEELPWGPHDWLSRPGFTEAKELLLVRVTMPVGKGHSFHRHPEMEEIIYVISGKAKQWVETEYKLLGPGEMAHIPKNLVHGTFSVGDEPLIFLAILSPADAGGESIVDVSMEEPWSKLS